MRFQPAGRHAPPVPGSVAIGGHPHDGAAGQVDPDPLALHRIVARPVAQAQMPVRVDHGSLQRRHPVPGPAPAARHRLVIDQGLAGGGVEPHEDVVGGRQPVALGVRPERTFGTVGDEHVHAFVAPEVLAHLPVPEHVLGVVLDEVVAVADLLHAGHFADAHGRPVPPIDDRRRPRAPADPVVGFRQRKRLEGDALGPIPRPGRKVAQESRPVLLRQHPQVVPPPHRRVVVPARVGTEPMLVSEPSPLHEIVGHGEADVLNAALPLTEAEQIPVARSPRSRNAAHGIGRGALGDDGADLVEMDAVGGGGQRHAVAPRSSVAGAPVQDEQVVNAVPVIQAGVVRSDRPDRRLVEHAALAVRRVPRRTPRSRAARR